MKTLRDHQIQQIADQIFASLKESGVESRDVVRIITKLTGALTDDITGTSTPEPQEVFELALEMSA